MPSSISEKIENLSFLSLSYEKSHFFHSRNAISKRFNVSNETTLLPNDISSTSSALIIHIPYSVTIKSNFYSFSVLKENPINNPLKYQLSPIGFDNDHSFKQ